MADDLTAAFDGVELSAGERTTLRTLTHILGDYAIVYQSDVAALIRRAREAGPAGATTETEYAWDEAGKGLPPAKRDRYEHHVETDAGREWLAELTRLRDAGQVHAEHTRTVTYSPWRETGRTWGGKQDDAPVATIRATSVEVLPPHPFIADAQMQWHCTECGKPSADPIHADTEEAAA